MRRWVGAALALLLAGAAAADLDPRDFRTRRTIEVPEATPAGLVYLPLDSDALRAESLGEFRIVAAGNREVPFRMVRTDGEALSFPIASHLTGEVGAVRVRAQDPIVTPQTRLVLDWAPGSRVSDVTVESGGRALRRVAPALGELPTEIVFPTVASAALRVRWKAVAGAQARLERVEVYGNTPIPRRLVPLTVRVAPASSPTGASTWRIDLGQRVLGLAELRLEVDDPSFDRGLSVAVGDAEPWASVYEGRLRRVSGSTPFVVGLDDRAGRALQVRVVDGDDAPLTVRAFQVWRYGRGLLFPVRPGQRYALWYGRSGAPSPNYDLERLPVARPLDRFPVAQLGPEVSRPAPAPAPAPWTRRYPWALWIALAGVVGLLAATIGRSVKAPPGR